MSHEPDRRKYKIQWETILAFGGLLIAFLTGGWSLYSSIDTRLRHIETETATLVQEVYDMRHEPASYDIPFRSRAEVQK